MTEAGDFDPGVWRGHDFGSARRTYDDKVVKRSYSDAKVARKSVDIPGNISTDSTAPLVIYCDVTGSMGDWPATIFSKLPYLEIEGKEYLGEDMEMAFGAVGDATCDDYPHQVRPFSKGLDLKAQLEKLIVEGHGGGQVSETYEIGALYAARNIIMPKAIKPVMVMIGDEAPYDAVNKEDAKTFAKVKLQKRITTAEIFRELSQKFAFYLILKPYYETDNEDNPTNRSVREKWLKLVDADHIADLPDPNRVVDVIFGILAKETGRVDYFREEIEGRQDPDQVETAYKALETIHAINAKAAKALPAGASTYLRRDDGADAKPLI